MQLEEAIVLAGVAVAVGMVGAAFTLVVGGYFAASRFYQRQTLFDKYFPVKPPATQPKRSAVSTSEATEAIQPNP